ncbi:fructose permease [uncultured Limosilactobacillus sp.]|uniref:fructose permease n=1 Tax=uncultured Limosilactobacillus sp. TaxID=2837629 RepID=UPI0025DC1350|nr:fructose permease [uncultured Limosilactobacillus sp.]
MENKSVDPTPLKTERTISMSKSIAYFALSIVINSLGNVLTLVTSSHIHPQFLGSAYWTAAENNLGIAVLGNEKWTLFWAFMLLGLCISFLNAILLRKLDWKRIGGNIAFLVPFSLFIQWFSNLFNAIMPYAHGIVMTIVYTLVNFFGVALIAIAISIYQRANLVLHPADDLFQILRFKFFKGNSTISMWVSYLPPTIMAIIAIIMTHQIDNFGLGTLFAFAFQGWITGWGDRHIFPSLKHQALDLGF